MSKKKKQAARNKYENVDIWNMPFDHYEVREAARYVGSITYSLESVGHE